MKPLTFFHSGVLCEPSITLEAMSAAMKAASKKHPRIHAGEMVDKGLALILDWKADVGPGKILIQCPGQAEQSIAVPSSSKSQVQWLPANAIVRLVPDKGPGVALAISPNATVVQSLGAQSSPQFPTSSDPVQAQALAWWFTGDVGSSSAALCQTLTGIPSDEKVASALPLDASDFGRCVKFLRAVPLARPSLAKAASISPGWAELVEKWDNLEALWENLASPAAAQQLQEALDQANPRPPRRPSL